MQFHGRVTLSDWAWNLISERNPAAYTVMRDADVKEVGIYTSPARVKLSIYNVMPVNLHDPAWRAFDRDMSEGVCLIFDMPSEFHRLFDASTPQIELDALCLQYAERG